MPAKLAFQEEKIGTPFFSLRQLLAGTRIMLVYQPFGGQSPTSL